MYFMVLSESVYVRRMAAYLKTLRAGDEGADESEIWADYNHDFEVLRTELGKFADVRESGDIGGDFSMYLYVDPDREIIVVDDRSQSTLISGARIIAASATAISSMRRPRAVTFDGAGYLSVLPAGDVLLGHPDRLQAAYAIEAFALDEAYAMYS